MAHSLLFYNFFVNESFVSGLMITFGRKIKDLYIMQSMYFFDGLPGKKIVITTTSTLAEAPKCIELFRACLETLTISSR